MLYMSLNFVTTGFATGFYENLVEWRSCPSAVQREAAECIVMSRLIVSVWHHALDVAEVAFGRWGAVHLPTA